MLLEEYETRYYPTPGEKLQKNGDLITNNIFFAILFIDKGDKSFLHVNILCHSLQYKKFQISFALYLSTIIRMYFYPLVDMYYVTRGCVTGRKSLRDFYQVNKNTIKVLRDHEKPFWMTEFDKAVAVIVLYMS